MTPTNPEDPPPEDPRPQDPRKEERRARYARPGRPETGRTRCAPAIASSPALLMMLRSPRLGASRARHVAAGSRFSARLKPLCARFEAEAGCGAPSRSTPAIIIGRYARGRLRSTRCCGSHNAQLCSPEFEGGASGSRLAGRRVPQSRSASWAPWRGLQAGGIREENTIQK
jgi:hypothetical protein